MFGRKTLILGLAVLAAAFGGLAVSRADDEAPPQGPVQIGMVQTLFTDIPQAVVNVLAQPFGALLKEQTGVDGHLTIAGDAFHVGKQLHDGKYQLGIFQGIEFTWAQQKYPDLRPLMIAVSKFRVLHAKLVVRDDCDGATCAALKGKDVAMPRRSKMHCKLFLERIYAESGHSDAKPFFGKLTHPNSIEDALDEVLQGDVQAAVVDGLGLENYKDIKPGCFNRLKVLQQSEAFPTGVIAYREGGLDKATLHRFREGMVNATKSLRAREMMALFQLTGFESIPAEMEQTMANILRFYPSPETSKTSVKTNSQ